MFARAVFLFGSLVWAALLTAATPGEEGATLYQSFGAQIPDPAPKRAADEGQGPFSRLVIDGVMIVDG
jgi:hypothetical protein